ncbi:MAG: branched-chain amino acid ABC transporter permease [Planctomycetes bacterium]|nr:branched-chain amino acid ABC transporter permease [Planctomycetota bacterium]
MKPYVAIGLAAVLLAALVLPAFIRDDPYIVHIFIMTFYIGSASMAWSILGGMTGQLSLGHATFMAFGAYSTSVLLTKYDLSPWVGMLVSFLVTGIMAVALFYPCFTLRGPYFTLATIAFGETFRNLFMNWGFVGRGQGILLPFGADSFWLMRFMSKVPYYYISLAMLVLVSVVVYFLDRSKLGYAFKTIREDEDTANAIGINTTRYKLYAAFLSAGFVSIAGVFYSQYIRYIDPDIMLQVYSVEFVLPAIIGGMGFVGGPLLGAVILMPLSEFLRATLTSVIPGANLIVYAIILILVIRVQPKGLLGWYQERQLERRRQASVSARFEGGKHAQG